MTFYTNRYPVGGCFKVSGTDSKSQTQLASDIPTGTVFVIDCICGNMFTLKTPTKDPVLTYVDASMLQLGFTETDNID